MSRLNELISSLCPRGVELKTLGEVATIERGRRVTRKELPTDGKFFVFQNSLEPLGRIDRYNYSGNTVFVIGAGAAGEVGYSFDNFWAADDCYPIVCGDNLDSRYIYHFLLSKQSYIISKVRKASVPRLSRQVIENIIIPLPPLEVQQEIVNILDKFTKLEAELEAELEARKKQYEFYRDRLLTFGPEVKTATLGEIGTFYSGLHGKSKQDFINGNEYFITY
ncbi:MAG: restriction endonuclease subunit S, partial [Synergistaceae bacterium]|nr:restriction endonuclease subunit S [Synergistaceae bacterium]